MTDWKGNEIKEGDEICLIKFLQKDWVGRSGFYVPQGNGSFKEVVVKEKPEPDKEVWEVGAYYLVHNRKGLLCITEEVGEHKITSAINQLMFFLDEKCFQIGIKGVSDTKE